MSRANKKPKQTTTVNKKPHRRSPDSQRVFRCPEPIGGRVLISVQRTAEKVGCCEINVYKHLRNEKRSFPRPFKMTPGRTYFFEDEVDAWIQNRIQNHPRP